nr:MAG TPA: hypothetical protein [Caudoviricetes sp.]
MEVKQTYLNIMISVHLAVHIAMLTIIVMLLQLCTTQMVL